MVWDYNDRSGRIENTLTFRSADNDETKLKSVWSQDRGDFILSFEDNWGSKGEISGVLKIEGEGFRLSVDNPFPRDSGITLEIEIIVEPGAQIKRIDYINLDKWGDTLLNSLENLYSAAPFLF